MFPQADATTACTALSAPILGPEVLVEYVLFGGVVGALILAIAIPLVFVRRRAKREPTDPQAQGKVTSIERPKTREAPN